MADNIHHSCALCRQRKVKCDKQNPCSYCISHRTPCVPATPSVARPRKKRFPEAELLFRLRKYETALEDYGADIQAILNDEKIPPSQRGTSTRVESASSASESTLRVSKHDGSNQLLGIENNEVDPIISETKCPIFKISSEDELEQGLILSAYDDALEYGNGSLLPSQGAPTDLNNFHPTPMQILHLWQVFLDNVHPLLKIFHAPRMQKEVLKAAFDLPSASPAMHAFLLAMYANSVTSMSEEDCTKEMNEQKGPLISRFTAGVRYALQQASFLVSSDVLVLQAYILYLYTIMNTIHPRSLVRLTGLAERTARVLGLHRTPHGQGSSYLDIEINRRIWWQVVLLDIRATELSASGTSILSCDWNVRFPLNVNEVDFKFEADRLPDNSQGPTDMIFCLVRCEVAEFLRRLRERKSGFRWNEFSNLSEPLAEKLTSIEHFERHLHSTYLDQCDPAIPIQILARYYALYSLSKMKIVAYRTLSYPDRPLTEEAMKLRQDRLMLTCIEIIEAYTTCAQNRLLRDFTWFSPFCFPFLAYVHLFFTLRSRTHGVLVTRAWNSIVCWHGGPGWLSPSNPSAFNGADDAIQLAFAKLSIAAWDSWIAVHKDYLEEPELIVRMRERIAAVTLRYGEQASPGATTFPAPPKPEDTRASGVPNHGPAYQSLNSGHLTSQDPTSVAPETAALDFSEFFMTYDSTFEGEDWQALLSFE